MVLGCANPQQYAQSQRAPAAPTSPIEALPHLPIESSALRKSCRKRDRGRAAADHRDRAPEHDLPSDAAPGRRSRPRVKLHRVDLGRPDNHQRVTEHVPLQMRLVRRRLQSFARLLHRIGGAFGQPCSQRCQRRNHVWWAVGTIAMGVEPNGTGQGVEDLLGITPRYQPGPQRL